MRCESLLTTYGSAEPQLANALGDAGSVLATALVQRPGVIGRCVRTPVALGVAKHDKLPLHALPQKYACFAERQRPRRARPQAARRVRIVTSWREALRFFARLLLFFCSARSGSSDVCLRDLKQDSVGTEGFLDSGRRCHAVVAAIRLQLDVP